MKKRIDVASVAPVHMLNLICLRDQAIYEDGSTRTGAEAYEAYSHISAPAFRHFGGRIVWRGGFELTMIGADTER